MTKEEIEDLIVQHSPGKMRLYSLARDGGISVDELCRSWLSMHTNLVTARGALEEAARVVEPKPGPEGKDWVVEREVRSTRSWLAGAIRSLLPPPGWQGDSVKKMVDGLVSRYTHDFKTGHSTMTVAAETYNAMARDAATLRLIVKHRINVWKGQRYWFAMPAFADGKHMPGASIHTAVKRAAGGKRG